ncbi:MAG TPA: protein translocase subunit SecD [Bacteroidota bacterium]|nr:protein translocase subunit SecD [Bacteroidota bacterium]
MKKYAGRLIIIAACIVVAVYYLLPTWRDYDLRKHLSSLTGDDSLQYVAKHETEIRDARARRIKLGLDLQGGMRVVLEVNVLKLIEDLAKNKDEVFNQIMKEVRAEARTSEESPVLLLRRKFEARQIRMSRYYRNLRDTNDDIFKFLDDESTKAIDRGMEIVRNRVDQYGVSEPSIQKLGGTRIIVELPGVNKETEVRQLLQGTALLEFKLLKEPEVTYRIAESIDKLLASTAKTDTTLADSLFAGTTATDTARGDSAKADTTKIATPEGELSQEEFARKHPFFSIAIYNEQFKGEFLVAEDNKDRVRRILDRDDVQKLIPNDMEFLWSAKTQTFGEKGQEKKFFRLYPVKKTAELTGGVIVNAKWQIDPNYNRPIVTMEMNNEGSREWARITGANINKRIAIVLDNSVFSAPNVISKITGGHSQIEGMESEAEAKLLEIVLKAGALPAPVDIIEQRSVGPSLGEDSIRAGIMSAGIAIGLTILFMAIYYHTGGAVADFALMFTVIFLLAVLAAFGGTLTMPGIAGIILTLAVAVDANVLIYERIREETAGGKTPRAAVDAGYSKAFTAIFDSNLTTLLTGIILYQFGTGPVQGFALTLMIGIVVSLFSAIIITRVVFDMMIDRSGIAVNFG